MNWQKEKPDYACVFVCRNKIKDEWDYSIYKFAWEIGEPPEDSQEDDTVHWYLAWLTIEGDEYGDIDEIEVDEYCVLEVLPTMDECHAKHCEQLKGR